MKSVVSKLAQIKLVCLYYWKKVKYDKNRLIVPKLFNLPGTIANVKAYKKCVRVKRNKKYLVGGAKEI